MKENQQEEIDLGLVFRKIGDAFRQVLVWFYQGTQFLLRNWIIILILVVGGAAAGHFWQKASKPNKLATLIIKTNFDSTSYVYQAAELLNRKNKQGDHKFLGEYGINEDELSEVIVEPIVNIMDLLEKSETSDRNLEQYLAQTDFEEDLLLSEVFYPEYKYHKLFIITSNDGTNETVQKVMDYLNSNEYLEQVRLVTIEEINKTIERNNVSIANIDAVYDVHAGRKETEYNPSQIFFKHQENNNLHQMITSKNELMAMNEQLKQDLVSYDKVVKVINKPKIHFMYTWKDQKRTLVPVALLLLFFGFHAAKAVYQRSKKLAEA